MNDIVYYALLAPPILIALTFHEYAHALVAYRLGDDTAAKQGRLTLNPLAHLDLLGTIMLFIVQLGWAKPVPVNPGNFRDPRTGMFWVALAGPLSNILLAFVFGILFCLSMQMEVAHPYWGHVLFMVRLAVIINLILAFFNLIPIPPLDGSKIAFSFVPDRYAGSIVQFSRFGPFILLGLIIVGHRFDIPIIWSLIGPPVKLLAALFGNININI